MKTWHKKIGIVFSGPIHHGHDQQHGEVEGIESRYAGRGNGAELTPVPQYRAAAIDMRENVAGDDEEQIDEDPAPLKEPADDPPKKVLRPS